jgi:hypothetical protein
VSETRSAPNRKLVKNQASVEYNTSSEVGIPMLRSQMNVITNVSHGHQLYTVDPCSQKCYIAARNTLWLYVRRLELRRHSHVTYKVDLCTETNHTYSIVAWIKKMRPEVFNPVTWKYESSHAITCAEVKHGRNHLITGH